MKRLFFISVLWLMITGAAAFAQSEVFPLKFSGYVRNYTGVLTESPNDFSIVQNTFNLNIEHHSDKIGVKVNPYLYHYFDRELELGLREAYLDLYFKIFDLRIGKQQIIWGKAEGVFITDVVSPKDLREFLLPDFDEIRTGITAFKANYYFGNNTLEAVWSPVFTPTQMPETGSVWSPKMEFLFPPVFDYKNAEIKASLENSELFMRFSAIGSKIDYEIVGGTFFYDDPAMRITPLINPVNIQPTGLLVAPEYHRVSMAGGSLSLPLGAVVFRAEGAYYSGRNFQTTQADIPGALVEKDHLHYMAGIDFALAGVKLSSHFIHEHILNYEEEIQNWESETMLTFLAKKDFLREKLWIELFGYVGLDTSDALVRPKLTYSTADGFDTQTEANMFFGDKSRFDQCDKNDMVYLKPKYSI